MNMMRTPLVPPPPCRLWKLSYTVSVLFYTVSLDTCIKVYVIARIQFARDLHLLPAPEKNAAQAGVEASPLDEALQLPVGGPPEVAGQLRPAILRP